MRIDILDKILPLLKGELGSSDEAALREMVAVDEDYAEDVAFSINLVKAVEVYERNKVLAQVKRLDALRTLRIRLLSGLVVLTVVVAAVVVVMNDDWSVTNKEGEKAETFLQEEEDKPEQILGSYTNPITLSSGDIELNVQAISTLGGNDTGFAGSIQPGPFNTVTQLDELKNKSHVAFLEGNYLLGDDLYVSYSRLKGAYDLAIETTALSPDTQVIPLDESPPVENNEEPVRKQEKGVEKQNSKPEKSPVFRIKQKMLPPDQEAPVRRLNTKHNKTYGYLYTWSSAKAACPTIMTIEDWDALIEQNGGIHDRMAADDKSTFQGLLDAGYPIALGGRIRKKDGPVSGFKKEGWYWSKTEASGGSAWAYYFYKEFDEYKIVKKKVRKTSYLSCLCPE